MEVIAAAESIGSVLGLCLKVYGYAQAVAGASDEQENLREELRNLSKLLERVREVYGESTQDSRIMEIVGGLQSALKKLDIPPKKAKCLRKALNLGTWPIKKESVIEALGTIERSKSVLRAHIELDIQRDVSEVKGDVRETKSNVVEVKGDVYATKGHVIGMKERVDDIHTGQQDSAKKARRHELEEVVDWICPPDFERKHEAIRSQRTKKTNDWILQEKAFQEWVGQRAGLLWCHGMPGAGKTYLASRVVDHLSAGSSGNTACVLYIYCDYKGSQTLEMILSALVRQLALRTGHVTPETKNLFNKHNKNGTRPWRQDWISILRPSLEKQDKGFIVIDALDELEADYILPNFLDEILKLQALTSILLVSREMETIRGKLSCVAIIEVRATDGDVRRHCQEFLALKDCLQEHLADNANFGLELTESIVSKAQGMFLLAHLCLQSLCLLGSANNIREAVENFPTNLNEVYDEMTKRIFHADRDRFNLAKRVIMWVTHAREPLTVKQLQIALAIKPKTAVLSEGDLVPRRIFIDVCLGLITVDEKTNVIRLVHYSIQEYFDQRLEELFPLAHAEITESCLTYLQFDKFDHCEHPECLGETMSWQEKKYLRQISDDSPFLRYAVLYWHSHAKVSSDRLTQEACMGFLQDPERVRFCSGLRQHIPPRKDAITTKHTMAVLEGLARSHDTSAHFVYAAVCGLDEALRTFLETGANVNHVTNEITALVAAISFGQITTIELLLKLGADVQALHWKALCACVAAGVPRISELILPYIQSRVLNGGPGQICSDTPKACHSQIWFCSFTAMAWAHAQWDMIDLLLGWDIHIGLETSCRDLLWLGSDHDWSSWPEAGIHRLLKNSTRPELSNLDRVAAMIVAADWNRKDAVVSILNASNTRDTFDTRVAYLMAFMADLEDEADEFYNRHLATLDPASKDATQKMDKWRATVEHLPNLTASLEERGCDRTYSEESSSIGTTYSYLLHHAAKRGCDIAVEALLAKGVSPNVEQPFTRSQPIQFAQSKKIIDFLVACGANVDAQSCYNPTRLVSAIKYGQVDIVEHLLSLRADIEGKIERRHSSVCGPFRCRGDFWNRPSFEIASQICHGEARLQILRLLRDHGANIQATDKYGDTALHWATSNEVTGPLPLVQLLLDLGLDPTCKNNIGNMPIDNARLRSQLHRPYSTDIVDILRMAMDNANPKSESTAYDHKKLPLIKRLTGQS